MKLRPERVTKFVGLSDRDHPSTLSPYECPNLRNVDFYTDTFGKRNGYVRVGESYGYLRDAALRLDGLNDYFSAAHIPSYDVTGNERAHIALGVLLRNKPPFNAGLPAEADRTLWAKGWDNATNNFVFRLYYDSSLNGGLGGWTMEVRDTAGPSTKTFSVNDGGAQSQPVGLYRYIEFGWFSAAGYVLKVYDALGTLIGSTAAQTVTWNNTSAPMYLGVGQIAAPNPDNGTLHVSSDYISATIAEVRFDVFSSVTFPTGSPISEVVNLAAGRPSIVNRELGGFEIDPSHLEGYWKLNDGMGITALDSSGNGNPFSSAVTGPVWEYAQDKVLGPSGIRFGGSSGFVRISHAQADVNAFFNPANNSRKWTFGILFVPQEVPNVAAVRDQCLFHAGIVAATPAPISIRVVANTIQVLFNSPAGMQTLNVGGLNLFTVGLNKRVRVVVWHEDIGANDQLSVRVHVEGTPTFFGAGVSWATGLVPAVSNLWHLGRTVTSATFPYTYGAAGAQGPVYGVLDDFYAIQDTGPGGAAGVGAPWFPGVVVTGIPTQAQLFNELGSVPNGPTGTNKIQFYLRMNEGSGSFLTREGAWSGSTAFLYPQQDEGVYWDHGIVEPFAPVQGRLIFDARIFKQQKQAIPVRSVLVVTGCTLSAVDLASGSVTILSGGLEKPGLCTAAQYGSDTFIGARNGRRPIRYNGQSVAYVGIEPPAPQLAGLGVSAGTGAFAAGTYQVYYTFTNPASADESNPSPPFQITLALNDRITAFAIPTSPDPQVTGRRIYMTAVNGLPGDAAYLVAEITDNIQTAPVLSITNVLTTGTLLEYNDNGEAPAGGVVAIFRDYLFVGGNQKFPTRAFFSSPLSQRAFDKDDDYEDLDSDIGDPIVALVPRADVLTAFGRDSRWDLWLTGLDDDPVDKRPTSKTVGCVSPQAVVEHEGEHVFVGERNVYKSSGPGQQSMSTPARPQTSFDLRVRGSVDRLLREFVPAAAWENVSCAMHRSRDQFYAALPLKDVSPWGIAGRNSDVLVFDFLRETWSRYDLECDVLGEVEDQTDATWIYAISNGFLVKLDTSDVDGLYLSLPVGGMLFSSTVVTFAGNPFVGLNLRGLPVWVWGANDSGHIGRAVIVRNTDGAVYLREAPTSYGGVLVSPTAGDTFRVGAFSWWADFIVGGQRQIHPKRPRWIVAVIREISDVTPAAQFLAIVSLEDVNRSPRFQNAQPVHRTLTGQEVIARLPMPGMARAYRVRISNAIDPATTDLTMGRVHFNPPIPVLDRYEMAELEIDYLETDAR